MCYGGAVSLYAWLLMHKETHVHKLIIIMKFVYCILLCLYVIIM